MSDNQTTIPPTSLEDVGTWLADNGMPVEDDLLVLVYYALSRLIGEGSGDRANYHNLTTPLAALGTRPLRRNGASEPAPFPQISPTAWPFPVKVKGWPQGGTALHRLGMSVAELDRLWRVALIEDDLHATLPVGVVCAFFPPPLWRMVAQVITWGPGETSYRLWRFLMAEAVRELAPTRARRNGGTVSKRTIRNRYALVRRLMTVLVELHGHGWRLPGESERCALLEEWGALPPPIDLNKLEAEEARTDRGAPELRLVRLALVEMLSELERRTKTKAGRRGMLKLHRDALLLSLLVVLGGRIGAISRIRPCDYDPARKQSDGSLRPAVRIFPGKTLDPKEGRWKPLPDEVARLVEGWLRFTGLDQPEYRERSIWMAEWGSGGAFGTPGPESPVGTLQQAVSGDGRAGRRAMLPRSEDDPYTGYSPHTLRHLGEQLAKRFGHGWLNDHPEHVGRISDRVFADALLDHSFGASDVNGYSDLERDREYFAGLAAGGVWELARGDTGARTAPDWDRIRRAQEHLDETQAVVADYQQRVDALKSERSIVMIDESDLDLEGAEPAVVLRRLYAENRAIARITAILDQAVDELAVAKDEFRAAQDTLARAQTMTVIVSDALSEAEVQAVIERPPSVFQDEAAAEPSHEPVRDRITCPEAARAWGMSEPQMRNWFKGRGRPPWDAEHVILEVSPRKRYLLVDRLDRTAIPPSVMRRINALLCQPERRG